MPFPLIPVLVGAAGLGVGFSLGRSAGGFVQAALIAALVYLLAKKAKVI